MFNRSKRNCPTLKLDVPRATKYKSFAPGKTVNFKHYAVGLRNAQIAPSITKIAFLVK